MTLSHIQRRIIADIQKASEMIDLNTRLGNTRWAKRWQIVKDRLAFDFLTAKE